MNRGRDSRAHDGVCARSGRSHAQISRASVDGKTRFYRARARVAMGSPPLVLFKRFTFVLREVDGGRGASGEEEDDDPLPMTAQNEPNTRVRENFNATMSRAHTCYLAESYCSTFIEIDDKARGV